ncbi:hypothetical protein KIPB_012105, partial [Kipferlia bialata]
DTTISASGLEFTPIDCATERVAVEAAPLVSLLPSLLGGLTVQGARSCPLSFARGDNSTAAGPPSSLVTRRGVEMDNGMGAISLLKRHTAPVIAVASDLEAVRREKERTEGGSGDVAMGAEVPTMPALPPMAYIQAERTLFSAADQQRIASLTQRRTVRSAPAKRPASQTSTSSRSQAKATKMRNLYIIVPALYQAQNPIYARNATEFLTTGIIRHTGDDAMRHGRAAKVIDMFTKTFRCMDSHLGDTYVPVGFRLIPDARMLDKEQWTRVVGVVSSGSKYQIDGALKTGMAPYTSRSNLFASCAGFLFYSSSALIPPAVKAWNVRLLEVSQNSKNNSTLVQFWRGIEVVLRS